MKKHGGDGSFSRNVLQIAAERECTRIQDAIRSTVRSFKRRGAVVAVSGGVDSAVVAALCAGALGPDRVLALLLPEKDSAKDTLTVSRLLVAHLGLRHQTEDITAVLEGLNCYGRRDAAVREVLPQFRSDYRFKIVLPSVVESDRLRVFSLVAVSPEGTEHRVRLSQSAYLGIVAASNFKQRVRKMFEYYYADKLNYAVAGTPNRLEYDQGFFVKNGDGAADLKPIAHLYKTQVYQLAEYLRIPEEITQRPPSTDTYSLPQSQQEFYFSLPYQQMDLCLYAYEHGVAPDVAAPVVGLSVDELRRVFRDIEQKRRTTAYLHSNPVLVDALNGRGELS